MGSCWYGVGGGISLTEEKAMKRVIGETQTEDSPELLKVRKGTSSEGHGNSGKYEDLKNGR